MRALMLMRAVGMNLFNIAQFKPATANSKFGYWPQNRATPTRPKEIGTEHWLPGGARSSSMAPVDCLRHSQRSDNFIVAENGEVGHVAFDRK
jgi:hypothetical protein